MNNRWLKYVIGGALVINALTLGFLFFYQQKRPMPPQEILVQALKLDAAQQLEFEGLRARHRVARDSLDEAMAVQHRIVYGHFAMPNPAEKDAALVVLGRISQEREALRYQNFANIRALCRPDQQAQFDSLLSEIVRLFDRKQDRPPPR